jgi:hypothetical protein
MINLTQADVKVLTSGRLRGSTRDPRSYFGEQPFQRLIPPSADDRAVEPREPRFVPPPAPSRHAAVVIRSRPIQKLAMVIMELAAGLDRLPSETKRLTVPKAGQANFGRRCPEK